MKLTIAMLATCASALALGACHSEPAPVPVTEVNVINTVVVEENFAVANIAEPAPVTVTNSSSTPAPSPRGADFDTTTTQEDADAAGMTSRVDRGAPTPAETAAPVAQ